MNFKYSLLFSFVIVSLLSSCKKEKNDQKPLPELGTCDSVAASGGFQVIEEGLYEFNSGANTSIKIDTRVVSGRRNNTFTITYKGLYTFQLWGDYPDAPGSALHENLNGKHLKDRIGNNRTVITPDGTKITLVAAGDDAPVTAFSIYHGRKAFHVNVNCNRLEYSADDGEIANRLDEQQADGETSIMEETDTHINLYNSYNENTPGNKVYERVDLGNIPKNILTQVNDLYDDPRLNHT